MKYYLRRVKKNLYIIEDNFGVQKTKPLTFEQAKRIAREWTRAEKVPFLNKLVELIADPYSTEEELDDAWRELFE
jgi:hypothetical protein